MANVIHSIVEIEKCQADEVGNFESVSNLTTDVEQGSFINLGALVVGEREQYNIATPATATLATEEVLLVASVEELYIPGQTKKDFVNAAGRVARAIHMAIGDYYKISTQQIDNIPTTLSTAVGGYITVQNGSVRATWSATLPTGVRFIAEVANIDTVGYGKYPAVAIRVVAV